MDATNLYGHSMSQLLPFDEIKFEKDICLEEILNTAGDNEIGYFLEVDLKYPDNIKKKTKNFPFCPENRKINPNKFNDYMNNIKPKNYTKSKKLICDWTDKKKYLIHYRMLNFFVRHGIIVEKIHEIISFKQSRWLEKNVSFKHKNEIELKMILRKTSLNYLLMLLLVSFRNFSKPFGNRVN